VGNVAIPVKLLNYRRASWAILTQPRDSPDRVPVEALVGSRIGLEKAALASELSGSACPSVGGMNRPALPGGGLVKSDGMIIMIGTFRSLGWIGAYRLGGTRPGVEVLDAHMP
jgi:hypothetical protein